MPFSIHPSAASRSHAPSRTTSEVGSQDSRWDEQGRQEQGISHVWHVHSAGRLKFPLRCTSIWSWSVVPRTASFRSLVKKLSQATRRTLEFSHAHRAFHR